MSLAYRGAFAGASTTSIQDYLGTTPIRGPSAPHSRLSVLLPLLSRWTGVLSTVLRRLNTPSHVTV